MTGAILHSGHAIGDGHAAVIVCVNPDRNPEQTGNFAYDATEFRRKGTAVGIAKNERIGTAIDRGL